MKYQSEIIKEIIDTRGHEKSSLHYESECIETWIEEAKGGYPKLCDYQSEWLNYISILDDTGGEDPEPPIGEFPYETITDVTEATLNNVVPYAYKSAVLKGNTKFRDIDTGDILDTFDETKNLELVSVEMPVLTTTGNNLFNPSENIRNDNTTFDSNGNLSTTNGYFTTSEFVPVKPNTTYIGKYQNHVAVYDENKNFISKYALWGAEIVQFTTPKNGHYIRFQIEKAKVPNQDYSQICVVEGSSYVYSPFKSNILTVNEPIELHGIGDVKDELDLLTGELTQRIGEIVLNGSEEGWIYGGRGSKTAICYIENYFTTPPTNAITNYFSIIENRPNVFWNAGGADYEMFCLNDPSLAFRIEKTKLKTLDSNGIKEWLSQNNLIIKYDLATPIIKTVDLNIQDQNGKTLSVIKPIEGTMNLSTSSDTIKPLFSGEIPVEAITQNLASFIDLETEE